MRHGCTRVPRAAARAPRGGSRPRRTVCRADRRCPRAGSPGWRRPARRPAPTRAGGRPEGAACRRGGGGGGGRGGEGAAGGGAAGVVREPAGAAGSVAAGGRPVPLSPPAPPCRQGRGIGGLLHRDRLRDVTGRLVLGGAPLGRPGDVGPRLRATMASADILAVEDTRRLHRLAADLEVTLTGRVVTFHESVERSRLPALLAALAE